MQLFGRRDCYTSATVFNAETIPDIINEILPVHRQNELECDYLINYYRGKQPIINRTKAVRDDIIYNSVVNYANCIVRDKTGYFLSSPIQYTLRDTSKQEVFDLFKKLIVTEEKASQDFSVALDSAICGFGYMMAATDIEEGIAEEDAPFELIPLDPRRTCVIRESKATHRPVIGFTYYAEQVDFLDAYTIYDVRTAQDRFVYRVAGTGVMTPGDLVSQSTLGFPIVPIVQYKNNKHMLGDFEIVLDILNDINLLTSNAIEDIAQFVQSILVLLNADITPEKAEQLRRDKILSLIGSDDQTVDAKYIAAQLNPESVRNLRESLIEQLLFITSTPDRRQAPSGGDTGLAVKLGNGYPAQENDARVKSMPWYEAERDMVRLMLAILHKRGLCRGLASRDLQPIINRTLMETAQSNAQVQQMLLSTKLYAPSDIMNIAPMTNDTAQAVANGQRYWGDQWGGGTIDESNNNQRDV